MFITLYVFNGEGFEPVTYNVNRIFSFGHPVNGPNGALSIVKFDERSSYVYTAHEPHMIIEMINKVLSCDKDKS